MEIENPDIEEKHLDFETENEFDLVKKSYSFQNQIKKVPSIIRNRRYKKLEEVL